MKLRTYLLLAFVLVMTALLLASCGGKAVSADPASIAKGGALYDKWWKVAEGATEPTGDNPLWSLQSTNTRTGSTTWRCKECHGWDYKGKDGAYSKGSHFTGFPGVYDAGTTKSKDELLNIMKGGNNAQHNFSSVLSEPALQDLVNFLSEGLIDNSKNIDYSTKQVIGADMANGKKLYTSTCVSCHGADGKLLNFGDEKEPDYVGTISNGNPWEILHKIRFGQPGSAMPSGVASGWSTEDAADVLGYAQSLPKE